MKVSRRRGVSNIIAAIAAFAMFFGPVMGLLVYFQVENHNYDVSTQNSNAFQISALSEELTVLVVQGNPLTYTASNVGGIAVSVVETFVSPQPSTGSPPVINPSALKLQVGQTSGQQNTGIDCSTATVSNHCVIELLTSRGRVFSQTFPLPPAFQCTIQNGCCPPNAGFAGCLSSSTAGIGALKFDFEQFYYYAGVPTQQGGCPTNGNYPLGCELVTPASCPPVDLSPLPSQHCRAYSVFGSHGNYLAFSVSVQNVDPLSRTIGLSSLSYVEAVAVNPNLQGGGRTYQAEYQIGTVNAGGVVQSFSQVVIPAGQSVTVYFVAMLAGGNPTDSPIFNIPVTPVWLLFTGTIGGLSWGENFPLTTVTWES